jgi:hypothetical protein
LAIGPFRLAAAAAAAACGLGDCAIDWKNLTGISALLFFYPDDVNREIMKPPNKTRPATSPATTITANSLAQCNIPRDIKQNKKTKVASCLSGGSGFFGCGLLSRDKRDICRMTISRP